MLTIQLGHPKINTVPVQEFKKVKDVFLKLFHPQEESVFMFWYDVPVRFRYHTDLYESFDELLAMVWLIQKENEGKIKATLTNQILQLEFKLYWKDDMLDVYANFKAFESLYDHYAEALNVKPVLTVSKNDFLKEWNTLLRQVVVSFKAGGILIEDGKERRKYELLKNVEQSIKGYGKLYTK